jgi:3-oxoadipate enol-lactonase
MGVFSMVSEVVLGGIPTVVHEFGPRNGKPVVVLHSAGLDGSGFRYLAAAMGESAGWRLMAPDLRGHGRSKAEPRAISLDLMAEDIIGLVNLFGLDKPALLGTSMGGVVAGHAARLAPQLWSDLAVVCSPDRGYPVFSDRAAAVFETGMAVVADSTIDRWFSADAIAAGHEYVGWSRAVLKNMNPEKWAATWRSFAHFEGFSPVGRTGLPVSCFAGAADLSTPPQIMESARQALSSAHPLTVIPGGTHQLAIEQPMELWEAWLARSAAE